MITPRDIARKTMTKSKKEEAKKDIFAYYVGRPLSYVLTIPFLYTKISPNVITFISILFSLAGFAVAAVARTQIMLTVAWGLFFLWNLFDGVDGNVARYRKQFSKLGTIYDTMGGYIAIISMLFATGIAAYNNGNILDGYLPWDKIALIVCGGLAAIFDIFPRLMMHNIRSTLKFSKSDIIIEKSHYGFILTLILNITSPTGGMTVFLMVGIWARMLDIFTYGYFVLNFLKMVASLIMMFRNALKSDNCESANNYLEEVGSNNDIVNDININDTNCETGV